MLHFLCQIKQVEMGMFKIPSNSKVVEMWYSQLSRSRATSISFFYHQKQAFGSSRIIFLVFFRYYILKNKKWKKKVIGIFFVLLHFSSYQFFYIIVTFLKAISVLFHSILSQTNQYYENCEHIFFNGHLRYFIQNFKENR